MQNHTQAFFLLWHKLQPPHQVPPVSIHAALQIVLILQRRGSHTVNIMPPLELLARPDVNTSATVSPPATKAIPTEPLLAYDQFLLIQSMAILFLLDIPNVNLTFWICNRSRQILARLPADLIPPGAKPRDHVAGCDAEAEVGDLLPIARADCLFHRLGAHEIVDDTR